MKEFNQSKKSVFLERAGLYKASHEELLEYVVAMEKRLKIIEDILKIK